MTENCIICELPLNECECEYDHACIECGVNPCDCDYTDFYCSLCFDCNHPDDGE